MQEGFLRVGKFDIQYVKWGSTGTKIVLLHSMGMDAHSMDLLADSLSPNHQILALTLLGHGDSTVPTENITLPDHAEIIRECIKRLNFTPYTLIGHSIGGRMGMILTSEHPEEIKGLILVDIAPPDPVSRPWRQQTPTSYKSKNEALNYLKKRYPKFAPEYYQNRLMYAFIEQPDGTLKSKPMGNDKMTSLSTDLWPYVERIRVPTLLIIGAESRLVTPEKLARMKRSIPEFTAVTIQGATHMIPQDQPVEFEETVRKFISKIN